MRPIALVTGANRGLGLEFVRQLKESGHIVIGTARDVDAADELCEMLKDDGDRLERLDIDSEESVAALARRLTTHENPIAI
ncbi:MAG: SDR family NAD(P)-dependent oxidoreductase, partial [Phycisphaerales bacterium]